MLKFSKARKRYERQGLLLEEAAVERAETECLADADSRARRNERAAERRAQLDVAFVAEFARAIRQRYPSCPEGREITIAEFACLKHSGRVGRSSGAKAFDEEAIDLAVAAHVRHEETEYDTLLSQGWERHEARRTTRGALDAVLERWRSS